MIQITEEQWKRLVEITSKQHMIADPGEYGLGTEPESYSDDKDKAFTVLCELAVDLMDLVGEIFPVS